MTDSTINQQDLGFLARTIIDSNMYMVLGTADESGQPWVSPVYYASVGYKEFYWVSSPEVKHSRNIAMRPQVSIVIFDSQARSLTGVSQSSLVLPLHMVGTNGS